MEWMGFWIGLGLAFLGVCIVTAAGNIAPGSTTITIDNTKQTVADGEPSVKLTKVPPKMSRRMPR